MDASESIEIRPLSTPDLAVAACLLGKLNPDTPVSLVLERLQTILSEHPHYHLIGAFNSRGLLGVCGAWVATKIWCGRYLEIDNLVVELDSRSSGVGTRLIRHLEIIAKASKVGRARQNYFLFCAFNRHFDYCRDN